MKSFLLFLIGTCLSIAMAEEIVTIPRKSPQSARSSQLSVPLVFQGGGWSQQFILQNVGDESVEGIIYFRDQSGFPWGVSIEGIGEFSSLEATLSPSQSITFTTAVSFDDIEIGFAIFDFDPNNEYSSSRRIGLQTILSLYSRSQSESGPTSQSPPQTGQGLPSGKDDSSEESTPTTAQTSSLVLLGRTVFAIGDWLHNSFVLFFDNRDGKNTHIAIQTPYPCFDLIDKCDTTYILRIRSLSGLVLLEKTYVQRNQTMELVDLTEAFPPLEGHAGSLEFVAPSDPLDYGSPPLLHLDVMALQIDPDTFTAVHAISK